MRQLTRLHSLQSSDHHQQQQQQGAAGQQGGGRHAPPSRLLLLQPAACHHHQQQQQKQQKQQQRMVMMLLMLLTWLRMSSRRRVHRAKHGSSLLLLLMEMQCVQLMLRASGSCLRMWLQRHVLMCWWVTRGGNRLDLGNLRGCIKQLQQHVLQHTPLLGQLVLLLMMMTVVVVVSKQTLRQTPVLFQGQQQQPHQGRRATQEGVEGVTLMLMRGCRCCCPLLLREA
jgi:hypothetical protein